MSRHGLLLLLLAGCTALALSGAGPAGAQDTPEGGEADPEAARLARWEADCRAGVGHYRRRTHLARRHLDVQAVCAEGGARLAAGASEPEVEAWLEGRVMRAMNGFAPAGARHEPGARYRLPYETRILRFVSQGPGGDGREGTTHTNAEEYHAFDFLMPIGTPVLAARAGTVARVLDGSTARQVLEPDGDAGNAVYVLHEDGTFAVYAHLEPDIPVREGEHVERGQVIGRAGNTGSAQAPHLHFVVRRHVGDGRVESVPIRFGARSREGFVPRFGEHRGALPPSRSELRAYVDGEPVDEAPIVVPSGAELALRIELRTPSGDFVDVTDHPRTEYASMTIWNLAVLGPGRVAARPVDGFIEGFSETNLTEESVREGFVIAYHGRPRDPDYGWVKIPFEVLPPAGTGAAEPSPAPAPGP